jgi:uncharacterized protein YbaP (TraB family)
MTRITRREALFITLAAAVAEYSAGPPLWVAERGSGKGFLFGQMPVRSGSNWFSSTIQHAFDSSTELWVENPEVDPAAVRAAMAKRPKEPTLAEVVNREDLERLHAVVVRAGMAANAFDGVPFSAGYPVVSDLADRAFGADLEAIPERVLRRRAKAAKKPVHSEWKSFEEVSGYLGRLPPEQQRKIHLQLFQRALDDAEDVKAAERRLTQWLAGNLEPLEEVDRRTQQRYPDVERVIGAERNKAWVPRIESIVARLQVAFVCVGILHLVGPESVQAHLARAGFEVRRV